MPSRSDKSRVLLDLAKRGPLRARELDALGVPRTYLRRLVDKGLLEQVDRGLYQHPHARVTELHSIAETMKRLPRGVICLLSALQIHGLTAEVPHAVWVLIDTHARAPHFTSTKIEIVRATGPALRHGVEVRPIENVAVRLTTPAKSVTDCFRYRRHVGLDVAMNALRDYLRRSRGRRRDRGSDYSVDALIAAAKADRITSVLRPYLEALA